MSNGVNGGAITIKAALADDHVRAVQILSSRPQSLSHLFVGRPADEAPLLAGRLFSLCGYSHQAAATLAVAAARGQCRDPQRFAAGILAERIGDLLRSLVIGWPDGGIAGLLRPDEVVSVREALAACRDLVAGGVEGVERVVGVAKSIGLVDAAEQPLLTRALAMLPADWEGGGGKPDGLGADDDLAVITALVQGGDDFAIQPALPGRSVETGAYARCWDLIGPRQSPLALRMAARLTDLALAVRGLQGHGPAVGNCGTPWTGQGFGAVESPRGRLYHWVKLDAAGMIGQYGIVAPTEWNFHPTGPFVSTLLGAKLGRGESAQKSIAWLAALFDPCVAFRVVVTEDDHA